jgi:hypothetical protein
VFVCDIERGSGNLVVTGGQDDVAYVWNIMSGEICLVCEGHKVVSHLIKENQTDIGRTGSKLQAQYIQGSVQLLSFTWVDFIFIAPWKRLEIKK